MLYSHGDDDFCSIFVHSFYFYGEEICSCFLSKNLLVLGHVLLLEHMLAGIRVSLGLRSAGIFPSVSGHKVSSGDQVMAPVELGSKGYRPSGGELC